MSPGRVQRSQSAARASGLTADSALPGSESIWIAVAVVQAGMGQIDQARASQRVTISDPSQPFALAFLSDLHFGNPATDYAQAKLDAEIIRDTPRLFCVYHGDGIDNWVNQKVQFLQRGQAIAYDAEVQLFEAWLSLLAGKLLVAVSGNHENWTTTLAGLDRIRACLHNTQTLYDPNESVFDLDWGSQSWKVKVRHKYRFGSVFNMTHGIEVNWERGGVGFDIGVGGHTHVGTVCRPFYRQCRKRYAVVTGTYKLHDEFGRAIGAAPCVDRGCGAMVFSRHGLFWTENLEMAADFLGYLRRKDEKQKKIKRSKGTHTDGAAGRTRPGRKRANREKRAPASD